MNRQTDQGLRELDRKFSPPTGGFFLCWWVGLPKKEYTFMMSWKFVPTTSVKKCRKKKRKQMCPSKPNCPFDLNLTTYTNVLKIMWYYWTNTTFLSYLVNIHLSQKMAGPVLLFVLVWIVLILNDDIPEIDYKVYLELFVNFGLIGVYLSRVLLVFSLKSNGKHSLPL